MKEFGSDFHFVDSFFSYRAHLIDVYRDTILMANGRQCIVALIRQEGWRRLWMPEYFCYEVIETIKEQTGIEVVFYPDHPLQDNKSTMGDLAYKDGDVLLRMNYFGMRESRSTNAIPVPVIEDHTHDLLGHWALYSDADWCFASLRKTLPLPEGGMLWSPKGNRFPCGLISTDDNEQATEKRWQAMQMKKDYLDGALSDKEAFRKLYVQTEGWFDVAELSLIDKQSREYIEHFDINAWQGAKRRNWQLLYSLLSDKIQVLQPEDDSCTMFSLVVLTESKKQRDALRQRLINSDVYPAILWQVPESSSKEIQDFSHRMLSIHCDGRYTEADIRQLANIVNQAIES